MKQIVSYILQIKVDGGGSGRFGVGSHLEFLGGGSLELRAEQNGRGEEHEEKREAQRSVHPHEFIL
jgi:hypothetical protein